jgi:formate dehydrogenase subunit gamma
MTLPPPSEAAIREVMERSAHLEGALLPMLHDLQHAFGWVPDAAVPLLAHKLNLSRAEVHGVLTFYHDFRRAPAGRHVLKLCQAEACQSRGSRELTAHAEAKLGVSLGETTADGAVTLEAIYCLGLCASGPAALIDGAPMARLNAAAMDGLIERARA